MAVYKNTFLLHTNSPFKSDTMERNNKIKQLGGILCNICDMILEDKKAFEDHFVTIHPTDEMVFTCVLCLKVFTKFKAFRSHCYRHVVSKRTQCKKCTQQYSSQQYQSQLSASVLDSQNNNTEVGHDNQHCKEDLPSSQELEQHVQSCNHIFNCHICDETFFQRFQLIRHMVSHTRTKNFVCLTCGEQFKTKRYLRIHYKQQHISNYLCNFCEKEFKTAARLSVHMNTHTAERPFRCNYCNRSYADDKNRDKHEKQKHKNVCKHEKLTLIQRALPDHVADDDNTKFSNDSELLQLYGTVYMNNGVEEFACSVCVMRFKCRRSWLRHYKRSHLNYKYQCNHCQKVIVCPKPIEKYESVPRESIKPFICDYCGAGFTDKGNLARHIIRVKHMKLNYECVECKKFFFSPEQLEVHNKMHSQPAKRFVSIINTAKKKETEKLFLCQCCDKAFSYHRSRVRHMRNEHGQKYNSDIDLNSKSKLKEILPISRPEQNLTYSHGMMTNNNFTSNTTMKYEAPDISKLKTPKPICYVLVPVSVPNQIEKNDALNKSNDISEQISNFIDSTPTIEPGNGKIDEIDNDILNYLDSYIHGNTDIDILKESIDIPEIADDITDLDDIQTEFGLNMNSFDTNTTVKGVSFPDAKDCTHTSYDPFTPILEYRSCTHLYTEPDNIQVSYPNDTIDGIEYDDVKDGQMDRYINSIIKNFDDKMDPPQRNTKELINTENIFQSELDFADVKGNNIINADKVNIVDSSYQININKKPFPGDLICKNYSSNQGMFYAREQREGLQEIGDHLNRWNQWVQA